MLICKYEKLLRTIIRNKAGNPDAADDVFSETCLATVRRFRRKGTADIENAEKWLKQVARSKCEEYWRSEQKRQQMIARATHQRAAALEQELHRELRWNELSAILDEMEPIYKDVIELWLEDWTFAEIGAKLGISENTAKSRKRIFVDRLRKHFGVSPPRKKQK